MAKFPAGFFNPLDVVSGIRQVVKVGYFFLVILIRGIATWLSCREEEVTRALIGRPWELIGICWSHVICFEQIG